MESSHPLSRRHAAARGSFNALRCVLHDLSTERFLGRDLLRFAFETYNLSKATFSENFFKLLKMRILCLISEKIELDELLELFVELQDLSSERRVAKEKLLTDNNILGKKREWRRFCM